MFAPDGFNSEPGRLDEFVKKIAQNEAQPII
jgi:hypothetical protein